MSNQDKNAMNMRDEIFFYSYLSSIYNWGESD